MSPNLIFAKAHVANLILRTKWEDCHGSSNLHKPILPYLKGFKIRYLAIN